MSGTTIWELPLRIYLAFSLILSSTCLRYTIKFPILYYTAISASLCLAIWSFYCFTKAVWLTDQEGKALVLAGVGLLLGALVFGYRPTLALGNPAVIPLLIAFLKRKRILLGLVLRLAGAALPDVIVAALLMAYNQARFGNSFEFRQSYQLTIINHCSLGSLWENLRPTAIMNGIIFSFFESLTIIVWLSHGGVPTFRRQFFVGCLITLISEETSLTATQP